MPLSQQFEPITNFACLLATGIVLTGVAVAIGRAIGEHHSIPWEAKKPLIDKYGLWAVNRAEAFCPENDVACVAREAERLYTVHSQRRT
jgi:hypothetical protein